MATRFTYIGDEDHARSLKSVGARELSQLRHDMHFQSLSQGRRYLELPDGTRIYTTSVGGYDLVTIHTPIRIEEKKKIKKEEYNELFFTKRFFIKLRKPGVVPFSLFWLVVLPDEVAEISDLDLDFLDNEGVVVLSTFVLVPITQIDVNNLLPSHRDRSTEYCSYEIPVLAEGSRRVVYTVSASNRYIRHQVQESAAALRIEELALTNEFMNVRVFGNRLLLFHSETTLSPDGYGVPEITVAWISFDPTGIPVQDNFGSDWHDNGLGRHGDGLHWSVIRAVSATELVVWYCAGREIFEYTVDVTSFPIQLVQSPERIEDAGVYTALWQLPVGYVETDTIEITIPHTFIPQTTLRCNMDNLDGTTVLTVAHTDYHWAQYTFFEIYDADILDISYSMGDISFTYDGHLTTSRYVSAQFFAHPATSFQEWVDMAHTWPRNCDATMFPLWHTITHVAAVCKGNSPHSHPYPPGGVTFKYGIVNDFEMYATVKQDRQDTHYARGMGEYDPAKSVKFYGTVDIGGPIPNCVAQVSNLTKIILKYGGSWASEGPHTDWPCLTVSGINQITVNYLRRQEIDCVLVPDGQLNAGIDIEDPCTNFSGDLHVLAESEYDRLEKTQLTGDPANWPVGGYFPYDPIWEYDNSGYQHNPDSFFSDLTEHCLIIGEDAVTNFSYYIAVNDILPSDGQGMFYGVYTYSNNIWEFLYFTVKGTTEKIDLRAELIAAGYLDIDISTIGMI